MCARFQGQTLGHVRSAVKCFTLSVNAALHHTCYQACLLLSHKHVLISFLFLYVLFLEDGDTQQSLSLLDTSWRNMSNALVQMVTLALGSE